MAYDADAIIVGAGLAGLVAAAELVDAGKRVIVLDQEPEQSLGGQAFWSLGGIFLVDSPEQRRMGIRDSHALALDRIGWARRPSTATRISGRANGRRPTWPSPPARSARGCTSAACAFFRWSAGRSAAATTRSVTAIRCRAFISPGEPGPACSRPSLRACAKARNRDSSPSSSGIASTNSREVRRHGRRRARRYPCAKRCRARPQEFARGRRRLRAQGAGSHRFVGRHRRQITHWCGKNWPQRLGRAPKRMITGVPDHVDGRMLAITEAAGGTDHQPRPHVALRRRHQELESDLDRPRHPHSAGTVVALARRPRQATAGAALSRLRYARRRSSTSWRPATIIRGSS